MTRPIRLGILTPSSNTALEPISSALAACVPGVTAHFARFRVTEISLREQSLGQFNIDNILAAAEMLADAKVDVIGWSGTSAGWLGFERDRLLCERIATHTGIAATTSVLALNELLALTDVHRIGLVSPYTGDVQQRIIDNYGAIGIDTVAEQHLDISANFDFALVTPTELSEMIDDVAHYRPQAITTFCTNLRAAQLAEEVEARLDIPLFDTSSTVIWKMLRMAGVDTNTVRGWGRMFQLG